MWNTTIEPVERPASKYLKGKEKNHKFNRIIDFKIIGFYISISIGKCEKQVKYKYFCGLHNFGYCIS